MHLDFLTTIILFESDLDGVLSFQGKMQLEERGAQGFSQPHHFVPHTFMPPSNCDVCDQMIIGIWNKGGYACR